MFQIAFSSLYEVSCGFTRNYETIKAKLLQLDDFDKTCIETAFHGVNQLVLGEWGNNTPCQVILVTDGKSGIGQLSLKHSLNSSGHRDALNPFPLPFSFPGKLILSVVAGPNDPAFLLSK